MRRLLHCHIDLLSPASIAARQTGGDQVLSPVGRQQMHDIYQAWLSARLQEPQTWPGDVRGKFRAGVWVSAKTGSDDKTRL